MPRQPILGFGAALTESSAYNLIILKQKQPSEYQKVLQNLFSAKHDGNSNKASGPAAGSGLQVLRIPISACDFNTDGHNFTLADKSPNCGTSKLCKVQPAKFLQTAACPVAIDLAPLRKYVLPALKDIIKVQPNLKLVISSWSAPKWMKTSDRLTGGRLKNGMQSCYGTYLADAAAALAKELNAPNAIHAITVQNEPNNETQAYASMLMTPAEETTVAEVMRARLNGHKMQSVRIWVHDHNWDRPDRPADSFKRDKKHVIDGAAFHCYDPNGGQVEKQSWLHSQFPDRAIHITECSGGRWSPNFGNNLRWNWQKLYWGGIKHWGQSVMHWNLALDSDNGPTNGGTKECRGVITINTKQLNSTPQNRNASVVSYEVEWYGMAHASRYLPNDAHYVESDIISVNSTGKPKPCVSDGEIQVVTYVGKATAEMLIMNRCENQLRAVHVMLGKRSSLIRLPPGSLTTLVWNDLNIQQPTTHLPTPIPRKPISLTDKVKRWFKK
ncbi:glycoside hydrolase superfamily [Syncephalis fuscata]|nr:glycoside hydrolase superfamily [Syncephalis fuscata]